MKSLVERETGLWYKFIKGKGGMKSRSLVGGIIFPVSVLGFHLFLAAGLNGGDAALRACQTEPASGARVTCEQGVSPELVSKLSAEGDILVKPSINGLEVGWFLIDPAAEGMRITAALAEELRLSESGTHRVVSSSKAEERRAWTCPDFRLGPCRAEGLELTEMAAGGEEGSAEPVVGVVGTALLRGVVVELEFGELAVRFYDPAVYDNPGINWHPFRVAHGLPIVSCRYEGTGEGEFGLDLRSPLGVVFFKPEVDARGFLGDKVTRPGTISGANFGKARVRTGVLEWFEAAGFRREKVRGVFLIEEVPLAAAGELAGLIGRETLGGGILILDYGRSRLALTAKGT